MTSGDQRIWTHTWRLKAKLPERNGQPCRIWAVANGPGPRSIGVEFQDGVRVITSRFSVRRAGVVALRSPL